jgi:CheY-like chemotaxis protein
LREKAENIFRASERARDLTAQLLAFGRTQPLDVRPVDLHELIDRVRGMWNRLLPTHLRLEVRLEAEQRCVRGDASQLELVLMNLVVNANDAMPEGGRLTVCTSNTRKAGPGVDRDPAAAANPGEQLVIEVEDTGQGIDPALLDRIFDPFFTTKALGKGTGLGLAMAHGTIEQHGGAIEVESEPGRGTRFRIHLPTIAPEAIAPIAAGATEGKAAQTGTVLLVDDNDMVREMTGQMLEMQGLRVLYAASGEEAVRIAEGQPEPIDLLLTDMIMPGMNGKQVWEHLHRARKNLRVIFTSGYAEGIIGTADLRDAPVFFLPKPYTIDQLAARVREAMAAAQAPPPGGG